MALLRCGGATKSTIPQYTFNRRLTSGGDTVINSGDFTLGTPINLSIPVSNVFSLTINVEDINSITVERTGSIQYSSGHVLVNKDGTTTTFNVGNDPIDVSNACLMVTGGTTDSSNAISFVLTANS